MKYIRTNLNEIYCLNDFTKSDKMVDCYVAKYFHRCINKNDIVATADTIEELCDGFYLDNNENEFIMNFYHHWWGGDNFVCDKDGYYVFNRNDFKKLKDGFYGYIKTDKGLIYVAKMNEKGELELL